MSTLSLQEFPVGFAESMPSNTSAEDTTFYVEWLDNSSEFPGLLPDKSNLSGGNWEVLKRKEIEEDNSLVTEDAEGTWSKISTGKQNPLYAEMTEKNAVELQPTKRNFSPVWSNKQQHQVNKPAKEEKADEEDTYMDDLGAELIDIHKGQSRRANRKNQLRKYQPAKTIDIRVEGVLRLETTSNGTTGVTWMPYDTCGQGLILSQQDDYTLNLDLGDKAKAIRSTLKQKKHKKHSSGSKPKSFSFADGREYSVLSPIVKRGFE